MIWNIEITAPTKAEAKDKLAAHRVPESSPDANLPALVGGLVAGAIDALPDDPDSTISVTTYGFFSEPGGKKSSSMRIVVENIRNTIGS